jgi:hypothetical protein
MSQTLPEQVPNRSFVAEKLDGAAFQIDALRQQAGPGGTPAAAESCACAAMDQLLQSISGVLHGFNQLLPEPLPASRVSLRNLRDEFQSVQSESKALRAIEQVDRSGEWLDDLQQKHVASSFTVVLRRDGDRFKLFKNPLDPRAGTESQDAADYLTAALQHTRELIGQVASDISDDVMRYREAHRQQTRRLI